MKTLNHIIDQNDLDPAASFTALKSNFPEAFFFQSPDRTIIGLSVEKRVSVKEANESFFSELQILIDEYASPSEIPFANGGAFGCIGFEAIAGIEPRLKKAGYFERECADTVAEIFFTRDLIVFENHKIRFAGAAVKLSATNLHRKSIVLDAGKLPLEFVPHLGKDVFFKGVKKLKDHIRAGDIFQAVLSERFETRVTASGLDIFSSLRDLAPSAYSFFFDFSESSFFGASPEMFVQSQRGELETHPIAGTRPRGKDQKSDKSFENQLRRSVKENAEHLMLVDLARNDLGRVSVPGTVKVSQFKGLMKLTNVMHLVSVVNGQKKNELSSLEAFKACFPAGTLSGAPKIRAMELPAQIETRPRGFYGGAVVAFDFSGDMDSCIAIRSIEKKGGKVILRAGAGIVADSRAHKEYEEIENKLAKAREAVERAEAFVRIPREELA